MSKTTETFPLHIWYSLFSSSAHFPHRCSTFMDFVHTKCGKILKIYYLFMATHLPNHWRKIIYFKHWMKPIRCDVKGLAGSDIISMQHFSPFQLNDLGFFPVNLLIQFPFTALIGAFLQQKKWQSIRKYLAVNIRISQNSIQSRANIGPPLVMWTQTHLRMNVNVGAGWVNTPLLAACSPHWLTIVCECCVYS